jgi:thiamine transporter ThiT
MDAVNKANNQKRMTSLQVRRLTYAALYLAIALVLPFITGQIPEIGSALCPMHIPALLCGFMCGWPWGLAVGLIAPLLRSVLFGMPPLYPTAIAMTFELAAYGALAGILYRLLPRRIWSVYVSLILAMLGGRIVWGAAEYLLLLARGTAFTPELFLAGAVLNAIPGIILHIVLIPVLVIALEKAGLALNTPRA